MLVFCEIVLCSSLQCAFWLGVFVTRLRFQAIAPLSHKGDAFVGALATKTISQNIPSFFNICQRVDRFIDTLGGWHGHPLVYSSTGKVLLKGGQRLFIF